MIVRFEKEYLSELYYDGCCKEKKYRFQPGVVEKYKQRIDTLVYAPKIADLFQQNSLKYKVLSGDKRGISSVRIDQKYRLEFVAVEAQKETIVTICTIKDITNHYK